MRLTLKARAKQALHDYVAARRPAWALAQPAQLALLSASIIWCQVGVFNKGGPLASLRDGGGGYVLLAPWLHASSERLVRPAAASACSP
jgi:CelD/BcsL family acetyltransferase involved in cellulose biosynthesis